MLVEDPPGEQNVAGAAIEGITGSGTLHTVGESPIVELSMRMSRISVEPISDAKWNWGDAFHLAQ